VGSLFFLGASEFLSRTAGDGVDLQPGAVALPPSPLPLTVACALIVGAVEHGDPGSRAAQLHGGDRMAL
jgi:hypothetical protein